MLESVPTRDNQLPPPVSGGPGRGRLIAALLLLFAVAFNLYHLLPEAIVQSPRLNDDVLHLLMLQGTASALASGQDPTDFWLGTINLGYPLAHHYQHLAYLPPAVLYHLAGGVLSLPTLLYWTQYLLLSLFPLSIYWSMRRFGFDYLTAAFAGMVAPLLSTNGLFGFDFASYVWRGSGLYTQLWGMWLLPPALAQGYVALRSGRGTFWAVLLVAATLLSHLVCGYIALVSLLALALIASGPAPARMVGQMAASPPERQPGVAGRITRLLRLGLLVVLVTLVTAYFVVPFWSDSAYMNRSVWEKPEKYDSYGSQWVLGALVRGELFDSGRFPWLTILAAVGLALCLRRWRDERYRIPVVLFVLWLLFYFGRPTWSVLLDLLPFSRDLHLHRLVAGVHLGGVILMGVGLAWPWHWALARRRVGYLLAAAGLTALFLLPAYQERGNYLAANTEWMLESRNALAAEGDDLAGLVTALKSLPPGRVYAGLGANWGHDYTIGMVPMYALLNGAGFDMLGYLYHALSLNADILVHFDESRLEHYDLFNVRYVVAPAERSFPEFVRAVASFGRHRLYQVETSGYFDLVGTDVAFDGTKSDFYPAAQQWLYSSLPGAGQHPALTLRPAPEPGLPQLPLSEAPGVLAGMTPPPDSDRGQVLSEQARDNAFQAEVDVRRVSTLLLKVTYHPNWHATVDGTPVETMMVMPAYVGIPVTPGTHEVRLEYRPGPLRRYLVLGGLLTLCLVALAEWRRTDLARLVGRLAVRVTSLIRCPGLPADLRMQLGIYLVFLAVYLMSAAGHFFSTDHVAVYMTTRSLVENHSLAIEPINDAVAGPDGRYYAVFGLGQSIVNIPFYLLGVLVDRLSTPELRAYWSGVDLGQWGGTVPIFFVSLLNQFLAPVICVVAFAFCRRLGFPARRALLLTLMLGFGTAVWVYARDSFQHPLQSLCLLLSIYILFAHKERLRARHALCAGLALALGILTRIDLILAAPLLGIYLLTIVWSYGEPGSIRERMQEAWRRELACHHLLAFLAPVVLALGLFMIVNTLRFGNVLTFHPPAAAKGWSISLTGLYGHLLSPGRSVFLYSPPLVLGLFGFWRFYQQQRREAVLFAAVSATYFLFYSLYGRWHGDWGWGPRHLLVLVPLWVVPIGYVLTRRRNIALAVALTALGVGVQILGVTINYSYIYWEWIRMSLSPEDAYLFCPDISAIPMHFNALISGRDIDLWLLWVFRQYGVGVFLVTAAVPVLVLSRGVAMLTRLWREETPVPRTEQESARIGAGSEDRTPPGGRTP